MSRHSQRRSTPMAKINDNRFWLTWFEGYGRQQLVSRSYGGSAPAHPEFTALVLPRE